MTYERKISTAHVIAALEGYMLSLSMIDDDDIIIDIKPDRRTGEFIVEVEKSE